MSGRYTHLLTWLKFVELYRVTLPEELNELRPSYNAVPTHVMPIIRPPVMAVNQLWRAGAWCPTG